MEIQSANSRIKQQSTYQIGWVLFLYIKTKGGGEDINGQTKQFCR